MAANSWAGGITPWDSSALEVDQLSVSETDLPYRCSLKESRVSTKDGCSSSEKGKLPSEDLSSGAQKPPSPRLNHQPSGRGQTLRSTEHQQSVEEGRSVSTQQMPSSETRTSCATQNHVSLKEQYCSSVEQQSEVKTSNSKSVKRRPIAKKKRRSPSKEVRASLKERHPSSAENQSPQRQNLLPSAEHTSSVSENETASCGHANGHVGHLCTENTCLWDSETPTEPWENGSGQLDSSAGNTISNTLPGNLTDCTALMASDVRSFDACSEAVSVTEMGRSVTKSSETVDSRDLVRDVCSSSGATLRTGRCSSAPVHCNFSDRKNMQALIRQSEDLRFFNLFYVLHARCGRLLSKSFGPWCSKVTSRRFKHALSPNEAKAFKDGLPSPSKDRNMFDRLSQNSPAKIGNSRDKTVLTGTSKDNGNTGREKNTKTSDVFDRLSGQAPPYVFRHLADVKLYMREYREQYTVGLVCRKQKKTLVLGVDVPDPYSCKRKKPW